MIFLTFFTTQDEFEQKMVYNLNSNRSAYRLQLVVLILIDNGIKTATAVAPAFFFSHWRWLIICIRIYLIVFFPRLSFTGIRELKV